MSSRPRTEVTASWVLLALASGAFAIGASQGGSAGVIVEQAVGLGTTDDVIGYSISSYALGVAIFAPLVTILLARLDRRRILLLMMVVAVVFNGLTALVPNVGLLVVVRFLAAIPHGVFLGAGSVVGARALGASRRGRAMAVMMSGFTVAIIVAVPLMKWMAANLGWRWSYGFVTLASLASLVLVALFVPSVKGDGGAKWRRDVTHLKGRKVGAAIAFCFIGFGGFATVFAYMVPILEKVDLLSVTAVSVVLCVNGIVMTIATLGAGKVTDISPRLSAEIGAVAALVIFIVLAGWGAIPAIGVLMVVLMSAAAAFFSQGAQTHFMDVIHASPMLGAAMSHASLNLANALGAAAGAVAIGAGFGYLSTASIAIAFTVLSFGVLVWGPGFRRGRAS